jgi:hypothetical protein
MYRGICCEDRHPAIQMSSTRCAWFIDAILAVSTSRAEAARGVFGAEGGCAARKCSRADGETKKRGRIR